jgi:Tfp pilus assembly protein FimT
MPGDLHLRPRPGVTLIEAVLVVVLLGAAAVGASFVIDSGWIASRTIHDLTHDTASTLRAARNTAITNHSDVHVRQTRQNGIDQLEIIELAGPFRAERRRRIPLSNEVRLTGRPAEIRFSADGSADRAASWYLEQGRVRSQIDVAPVTGQVVVRQP